MCVSVQFINVSLDEDPFGEGHNEFDFPKDRFTTLDCILHTWEVEYGENTTHSQLQVSPPFDLATP